MSATPPDRARLPLVFTAAEAKAAGLGDMKTRSPRGDRLSRGIWALRSDLQALPADPAAAWRARLTGELNALGRIMSRVVAAHETAAALHGMPLPAGTDLRRIHLARPRTAPGCRREKVTVWRTDIPLEDTVELPGLEIPATSMRRTLLLAATTWSREDLVCAVDWMIRQPRISYEDRFEPFDSLEGLGAWLDTVKGRHGSVRLREAMRFARMGSDSPQETRLRLALTEAGLPEPACNPVLLAPSGHPLPPPDLAFPQWRVAVEYQGKHHFTAGRSALDIDKRARFESAGWSLIEVHAAMARNGWAAAVSRVREGLRSRGWPG